MRDNSAGVSSLESGMADLLRDLAIAWKNLAAYPPGHPRRSQSLGAAQGQLARIVPAGDALTLGVLRDGLLLGDAKLDGVSAQRLGEALHRRHVAVITFAGDTTARELETFLRLLAVDPRRAETPLWDELASEQVHHIALRPIDYEGVTLSDKPSDASATPGEISLGEALVRELLVGRSTLPFGDLAGGGSAAEVAALIGALFDGCGREDAREAVAGDGEGGAQGARERVDGGDGGEAAASPSGSIWRSATARLSAHLSKVVHEYLARARGDRRIAAAKELAELVLRLPAGPRLALAEAAVRALGASGADAEREASDGPAFDAFAQRLPPVDVLEAVRRAAQGGARLSARVLRLAQMLESAQQPAPEASGQTSARVLAELENLFRDDDVDRVVNAMPDADRLTPLELPRARALAPGALPDLGPRLDTLAEGALAAQMLATLLDLVLAQPVSQVPAGVLSRLEDLYRELLVLGRFGSAIRVISTLRSARGGESLDETSDDLRRLIERLGNRESVRALLAALRDLPDSAVDEGASLVKQLGAPALRHLLGLLSEEQDRSLRHRLLALLSALGDVVVPEATLLLQDQRWFVVRNMVVLLRTVGDHTTLPTLRQLARHADLRVRLEAIKSLFAFDDQLPLDLLARALEDPDAKLAESAVGLAGAYNMTQAAPLLISLLGRPDRLGRRRAVRLRALRTLGVLGQESVLPELDRLFLRERWFRKPAAEERAAAFRCLAGFSVEARQPFVERGLKSRDAAVRATSRALAEGRLRAEREVEETL